MNNHHKEENVELRWLHHVRSAELNILKEFLLIHKNAKILEIGGGDGPYKDKILPKLEKFENFKWLGHLDYPNDVRDYLSEIDVYALVSGHIVS